MSSVPKNADKLNLSLSGSVNILWISNFVTTIWEVPILRFTRERRLYIHHFIFNNNFAVHFFQSLRRLVWG